MTYDPELSEQRQQEMKELQDRVGASSSTENDTGQ